MGRQIIKQPNGYYAEYSTITDQIVFYNATEDQLIQEVRKEAADEAERQCRQAIKKACSEKVPFLGVTWDQALENHNKNCSPGERIGPEDLGY